MSSKAERAGENPALSALGETGLYEEFVAAEDSQAGQAEAEKDHRRRLGNGRRPGARSRRLCRCSRDPAVEPPSDALDICGRIIIR